MAIDNSSQWTLIICGILSSVLYLCDTILHNCLSAYIVPLLVSELIDWASPTLYALVIGKLYVVYNIHTGLFDAIMYYVHI